MSNTPVQLSAGSYTFYGHSIVKTPSKTWVVSGKEGTFPSLKKAAEEVERTSRSTVYPSNWKARK